MPALKWKVIFQIRKKLQHWGSCFVFICLRQKGYLDEQLAEMKKNLTNINYKQAGIEAALIIHLWTTSSYVGDNTDLIVLQYRFELLKPKLATCIDLLKKFNLLRNTKISLVFRTLIYRLLRSLLTDTGEKRACIWAQELLMDLKNMERVSSELCFQGVKGTAGTRASLFFNFIWWRCSKSWRAG